MPSPETLSLANSFAVILPSVVTIPGRIPIRSDYENQTRRAPLERLVSDRKMGRHNGAPKNKLSVAAPDLAGDQAPTTHRQTFVISMI